MLSNDEDGPPLPPDSKPTNEVEALAHGWSRCFVAEEPRLSEMVETYEELGARARSGHRCQVMRTAAEHGSRLERVRLL